MTWLVIGLIVLLILGSIIVAIFKGISDFFESISKYFDDREKKVSAEKHAKEKALRRQEENESNRKLFIDSLDSKRLYLEEKITHLQEQLQETIISPPVFEQVETVNTTFELLQKELGAAAAASENSIKSHGITKLRALWSALRPDTTPKIEFEKLLSWENTLLSTSQSYNYEELLRNIPAFKVPVVSFNITTNPPCHTPPEKPTFELIKAEYENWGRSFKTYDKEKFLLSESELERHANNRVLEWEVLKLNSDLKNKKIEAVNQQVFLDHEKAKALLKLKIDEYNELKSAFQKTILEEKRLITNGDSEALTDFIKIILYSFPYPTKLPQDFELEYSELNKGIVINYRLPSIKHLPQIKERKFLKTKNTYKDIPYKETELHKIYDSLLYKITLAITYTIAKSIPSQFLALITFNGWVRFVNPATGNKEAACILSLQCIPKEILDINLKLVNPAECFKKLKGIGSTKLYGLVPVKPIIELNRKDKRFVQSHSIETALSNVENIASMPWEEFEHLIRGLFEKEFSKEGAEVRVTRASRDGGVDAVVFDPDPLRGGKIVIQAKRYINTVGVEAVRDLFGTVHSENAIKGILVTTADYSPEAYTFAKDKPITLINGNNLLHLLMNHGYNVKIDLVEARELYLEEKKNQY